MERVEEQTLKRKKGEEREKKGRRKGEEEDNASHDDKKQWAAHEARTDVREEDEIHEHQMSV